MTPALFATRPPRPTAQLRVDDVSASISGRRVLSNISFVLPAGERWGLIGENGSGKSTLLRLLAGELRPDAGRVLVSAAGGVPPRVGLLRQDAQYPRGVRVGDAVAAALRHASEAETALAAAATALAGAPEDTAAAEVYAAALATAELLGVWDAPARCTAVMAGLGVAALPRERAAASLSGGQQARLRLAFLLVSAPDILLLDEPTNHLDDAASGYLSRVLTAWPGPVLVASHDRAFLNEAVTSLLDLDPAPLPASVAGPLMGDGDGTGLGVTRFTGSYTAYLQARMDARERWERAYDDEQAQLRRVRATVRVSHSVGHQDWTPRTESKVAKKFYADRNARVISRRVNDAQGRLEKLEAAQLRKPPRPLSFRGLARDRARGGGAPVPDSTSLGALTAVGLARHGRVAATSLTLGAGERLLLTGANGSGKSTLLHLLAGRLRPSAGLVSLPSMWRVALLSQEVQLPDPQERGSSRTVAQAYTDLVGAEHAQQVPLASLGLLAVRDEHRPLRALSLGQQCRVALAVVLADPPEVLLLDEPTNHLSLLLVTQLEAAIPQYPGIVIVASHDRWLRRRWTGRQLELTAVGTAPSNRPAVHP